MKTKLLLERYSHEEKQTIGNLYLVDEYNHIIRKWHSLELPDKNNKRRVSRIPSGHYIAKKHNSPKFGNCLWLQNVKGRSEILIHAGNFYTDILGCILIGKDLSDINKDGVIDVVSSRTSVNELMSMIGDSIQIEII